jgi:hypothetical protein
VARSISADSTCSGLRCRVSQRSTPVSLASIRLALSKFAPERLVLVKSEASVKSTSNRLASMKSVSIKLALLKFVWLSLPLPILHFEDSVPLSPDRLK